VRSKKVEQSKRILFSSSIGSKGAANHTKYEKERRYGRVSYTAGGKRGKKFVTGGSCWSARKKEGGRYLVCSKEKEKGHGSIVVDR